MPNTLIPMVRKYRKGGASHKKGALPGRFPGRFPGLFVHFTSGTTVILRSAPKLNSVTIGLAYVFRLKHYLRFLGRFDISPHSLLQLAERFVRSVQELNFSIVGHSRWSFKIEYYKHIHCQHTIPKASNSKAIFGHDALTQAILFSAPGHFHRCLTELTAKQFLKARDCALGL